MRGASMRSSNRQAERRVAECARLGFNRVILPKYNLRSLPAPDGMQIIGVETVSQAMAELGVTGRGERGE